MELCTPKHWPEAAADLAKKKKKKQCVHNSYPCRSSIRAWASLESQLFHSHLHLLRPQGEEEAEKEKVGEAFWDQMSLQNGRMEM